MAEAKTPDSARAPAAPHRRGRAERWRSRLALALAVGLSGCAQSAILEPVVPQAEARLLEAPLKPLEQAQPELLRGRLELFGLGLADVESALCPADARGPATVSTRVVPSALVNVLRKAGGEARTELSALALAPSKSEYHFRDGDLLRHYRVEHLPGAFDYVYDNGGVARRVGHQAVPEGAHPYDMQAALVLLRSWRPRLGEEAYFYAVLGRRLWRVDVTSSGPEVIGTAVGPQLSHRIDGVAVRLWQPDGVPPRRFSLWLSEAAERVPLRLVADASLGEVTLTLSARESVVPGCGHLASVTRSSPD